MSTAKCSVPKFASKNVRFPKISQNVEKADRSYMWSSHQQYFHSCTLWSIIKYFIVYWGYFYSDWFNFLFKNKSLKPNKQNMVNSWVKQDEIHAVAVWKTNRFFWCMDNVLLEEITIFEYLQIYKTYLGKVLRV